MSPAPLSCGTKSVVDYIPSFVSKSVATIAKTLTDAVIYILLALGLYGVATLAFALVVLPFALSIDPQQMMAEAVTDSTFHIFNRTVFSNVVVRYATYWWNSSSLQSPEWLNPPEEIGNVYTPSFLSLVALAAASKLRR